MATSLTITSSEELLQQNILMALVYEEIEGKKILYRDYQKVLNKEATLENIMGSSELQVAIISVILRYLYANLPEKDYFIATNELGLHLDKNNNLSSDIAIYPTSQINFSALSTQYFKIPPKIIIEVDTKADFSLFTTTMDYFYMKTQKLLDFGVEKVIWLFTNSKMMMIATPNNAWLTMSWNTEIELMENYRLSIGDLLKQKGIMVE